MVDHHQLSQLLNTQFSNLRLSSTPPPPHPSSLSMLQQPPSTVDDHSMLPTLEPQHHNPYQQPSIWAPTPPPPNHSSILQDDSLPYRGRAASEAPPYTGFPRINGVLNDGYYFTGNSLTSNISGGGYQRIIGPPEPPRRLGLSNSNRNLQGARVYVGRSREDCYGWWHPTLTLPPPAPLRRRFADGIRGRVAAMARNKKSRIMLEERLKDGWPEVREVILEEVKEDLEGIATHCEGSVLLRNIVRLCSVLEIKGIVATVLTHPDPWFMVVCISPQGARVMEELVAKLNDEQQCLLVQTLLPYVMTLSKDASGMHVIRSCIDCLSLPHGLPIAITISSNAFELALDKHGCIVVQDCLGKYLSHDEIFLRAVAQLVNRAVELASHPHGNYVLQFVVNTGMPSLVSMIISQILDRVVEFSMDKHASHVVECCIRESHPHYFDIVVNSLITNPQFLAVTQDECGNYVIQTAIERASLNKGRSYHALRHRIMSVSSSLESHRIGNSVLKALRKRANGKGWG